MKKLIYIAIALLFCTTVQAGKSATYYQSETWNTARAIYELADCTKPQWSEFYWTIQTDINAWVETYSKRERSKLHGIVAWAVLESADLNWSCS